MHVSNSRFSSKTFICAAAYGFLFRVEQRRFKICAIFNHLLYARAFLGKFKTLTTSFCVYFGTKQNWQFWNSGPSYTHLKTHARMLIILQTIFKMCSTNKMKFILDKNKEKKINECRGLWWWWKWSSFQSVSTFSSFIFQNDLLTFKGSFEINRLFIWNGHISGHTKQTNGTCHKNKFN